MKGAKKKKKSVYVEEPRRLFTGAGKRWKHGRVSTYRKGRSS